MNRLEVILAHKRREVARRKASAPLDRLRRLARLRADPLDFAQALRRSPARPALIAEIKRASPSAGLLTSAFDPLRLAQAYAASGAAAVSVLTDERFFGGDLEHLSLLRAAFPDLPLLRKDFILDAYQLYESRAAGADAVLLIAAALSPGQLRDLYRRALDLGLTPLVEVHSEPEVETALACGAQVMGVNHRDLQDFSLDMDRTVRLRPLIPQEVLVVAESGIRTAAEMARMEAAGADAVLVGEALMRAEDPGAAVRELIGRSVDEG